MSTFIRCHRKEKREKEREGERMRERKRETRRKINEKDKERTRFQLDCNQCYVKVNQGIPSCGT